MQTVVLVWKEWLEENGLCLPILDSNLIELRRYVHRIVCLIVTLIRYCKPSKMEEYPLA